MGATSGQPFSQYVQRSLVDPLGLRDTRTEHPDELRGRRLATGYTAPRRDGSRQPVPSYSVRGIAPSAGFTSTVLDLGRFATWQFRVLAAAGGAPTEPPVASGVPRALLVVQFGLVLASCP